MNDREKIVRSCTFQIAISNPGTLGETVIPVLCDTVVAVAVVVEIDLEVKESVVHYCSAAVKESFGAIINVLVTFPIFFYHLFARKNVLFPRGARTDLQRWIDFFPSDLMLVILYHQYFFTC